MTWLIVIIVAAVVCGVIGFITSNDGERGEGAFAGAAAGTFGCGSIIFQLFLGAIGLGLFLALIGWLFG